MIFSLYKRNILRLYAKSDTFSRERQVPVSRDIALVYKKQRLVVHKLHKNGHGHGSAGHKDIRAKYV